MQAAAAGGGWRAHTDKAVWHSYTLELYIVYIVYISLY